MEIVLDPSSPIPTDAVATTSLRYAPIWRRASATAVNLASFAPAGALISIGLTPTIWLGWACALSVFASQVALICLTGNTLGGWVLGCKPVRSSGRSIGLIGFVARDWFFWTVISLGAALGSFILVPLTAALRGMFGETSFLTERVLWQNGGLQTSIDNLAGCLGLSVVITLAAWSAARRPDKRAFHDIALNTIVIRTRGIFG